ncbi:MAG: glycoside hydrolase family 38 C-terminal domain-containing protein [Bryobacteraceae bacterium]|jgi:alpha-mannosidase
MAKLTRLWLPLCVAALAFWPVHANAADPAPDLTRQPTLYVVGYAHLDTEWRWEYPQVISEYIPNTMHDNFALFEKYPHYIFNFSGSNRYRFMKEYFPADFARLKQYVDSGRWFPAGSSVEEGDVNAPSAEGIIRQILYGNNWFRQELGKASAEYMLPDCFGFPASLPSILAHAGVKGFSTQKLEWGSSADGGGPESPEKTPAGTPFDVGVWVGPDGKSVLAALNPGAYDRDITTDLSQPLPAPTEKLTADQAFRRYQGDWAARVEHNGKLTGVYTDYHYYGVGDIGGAPREPSVKLLEAIVTKGTGQIGSDPNVSVGNGPVHVVSSNADQMFLDITPAEAANLPRYTGEMELTNHSAGSLTSQAYQKRWIRKEELLADAAEKSSVAAEWLGARPYPRERLNNAWTLAMAGHFHDLAAGTATPKSYEFAWNDDVIAMNQFAGVMADASEAVAAGLDTQTRGAALVVYNSLNIAREDLVEAKIDLPAGAKAVRVVGPDGTAAPAQLSHGRVLFLAKVPSVGYAVYDVEPAAAAASNPALHITASALENARYRLRIDPDGDIASIFDKSTQKELLSAPARLAISYDNPTQWPAWNMDWDQEQAPPRSYVSGPATIRVTETGPVRVSVEITRETEGSKFVQTVSLSAGDAGNRIEIGNVIDWKTRQANLKAVFPLTAYNRMATYNWDIGTIDRPTAEPAKFEVPSHQWIDLTDASATFGATILTDCKNGSDKPRDNVIRLTLLRTPGTRGGYADQGTQDIGHHEFVYGIAAHAGDRMRAATDWQAWRLNQPLIAFQSARHAGPLGKRFSLLKVSNPRIRVLALKKAEAGDEVIVRMVELDGRPAENVRVSLAGPVVAAREVNGQEQPVGAASISGGALVTSFTAFEPRTFALKLGPAASKVPAVRSRPVDLAYDLATAAEDGAKSPTGFDGHGDSYPAEMLPATLTFDGVSFRLAPAKAGAPNAVAAKGQTLALPAGSFRRAYVLAASADGDQKAAFRAGNRTEEVTVENWGGFVGQWDNRIWQSGVSTDRRGRTEQDPYHQMVGLTPGYIKPAAIAWYASHHHDAQGANVPYAYSYLFAYAIDLPAGAKSLTLPDNDKIRVLAVSVAETNPELKPAQPLYDTLARAEP